MIARTSRLAHEPACPKAIIAASGWGKLPKRAQMNVLGSLSLQDAAALACTSRANYSLVNHQPRVCALLLGPRHDRALPKHAHAELGRLLKPYGGGIGQADELIRNVHALGEGLTEENLFEADLRGWQTREMRAGNRFAREIAEIIRAARESAALSLDLGGYPVRSLPQCIGQLSQLTKLDLGHCASLVSLPHSFAKLALQELVLYGCESLVCFYEIIEDMTTLRWLNICHCAKLRNRPLPASLNRPDLKILRSKDWNAGLFFRD